MNALKYNLKNRPRNDAQCEYEEWFEGFEKELREKYREHKEVGSIGANIIAEVYKEILGGEHD